MVEVEQSFYHSEKSFKDPQVLFMGAKHQASIQGLYVGSLAAPPILNKLQVIIWTILERACSRNGTSLASTLSGQMPRYQRRFLIFS